MALWIIEKIVMPGRLRCFLYGNELKSMKEWQTSEVMPSLLSLCTHRNEMAERERDCQLVLRILMQCHIAPFCQQAVRPYGSFREMHAGTVDVSGQAWLHRWGRQSSFLSFLLLVTLTETSLCKGLSTLPALDIFREAFLILQYFFHRLESGFLHVFPKYIVFDVKYNAVIIPHSLCL